MVTAFPYVLSYIVIMLNLFHAILIPLRISTPKPSPPKKTHFPQQNSGGIARLVAKLLWLEAGHPDLVSEIQGAVEKIRPWASSDTLDDHPPKNMPGSGS